MASLIYGANISLDGYIEDAGGGIGWTAPDEEVHRFWNDNERNHGVYLYGRRLYETMAAWETDPSLAAEPVTGDFAEIWQRADKVVYSTTLTEVTTSRTRIEPAFDPEAVRQMKDSVETDMVIGGATLAAHAFDAGLIDEVHLVVVPVALGAGKHALPGDAQRHFELLDTRRFAGGAVFLRYHVPT
jgi:dihydrofolate reductase